VTIPASTTTITVKRRQLNPLADPADPDEYPTPEWKTVESEVPAVISPPSASNKLAAGDRITFSARLICDPADVKAEDVITDAVDGTEWTVLWARPVVALGLDHVEGQLRMVSGFAQ
jgi:hypothetical protein